MMIFALFCKACQTKIQRATSLQELSYSTQETTVALKEEFGSDNQIQSVRISPLNEVEKAALKSATIKTWELDLDSPVAQVTPRKYKRNPKWTQSSNES